MCVPKKKEEIPFEDFQVDDRLDYIERQVAILDKKVNIMRKKEVQLFKVQWQHRGGLEWTWEPESDMRDQYPELFPENNFEGEV